MFRRSHGLDRGLALVDNSIGDLVVVNNSGWYFATWARQESNQLMI
jgi:hypothetical protein